jgi:hypothetical protein
MIPQQEEKISILTDTNARAGPERECRYSRTEEARLDCNQAFNSLREAKKRQRRRSRMNRIAGVCLDVCQATEFVSIITMGADGPHVVGNWGEYMRVLGVRENILVFPAGRYRQTEQNLQNDNRIQLLVASKQVQGSNGSAGQGCLIVGRAEILTTGDIADKTKARFRWARGALVVRVEDVKTQL